MNQRTHLILVLTLFLLPACAVGRGWWSGQASTGSYEVQVLTNGYALPVYSAYGRSWVQGQLGERYLIRVHNRSDRRVEAVVAVDGRDVIDGRSSSLDKRGYVIQPWSYVDIDGFRLNMSEVAAFRFTTIPDSYASRMGTPWDVGEIGVAIFPEKEWPRPRPPYVLREGWDGDQLESSQAPADRRASAKSGGYPSGKNLGTQFGERTWSGVSETQFIRQNASWPSARLAIRYDDREGLCAIGLGAFCYRPYPPPPPPPPPRYWPPQPPQDFSPPPPGWEHYGPWY